MNSLLFQQLKLSLEPVAICFTDRKPDKAIQFRKDKGGCVGNMLVAAAKGKTAVFDRETYGCPGGGAGLGFGDTFGEDFPIECLLSTGDEALVKLGKSSPFSMGRGERFFASPEIADHWRRSFPFADIPYEYVVFKPFSKTILVDNPVLVCIFAGPDQLSCLVIMAGFHRGGIPSVAAPFGAACQSIVFAYQESRKENPQAIMGFFDISQRHYLPKDLLSFTVPFTMYQEMENSVGESCLTTEEWAKLVSRQ
jgi:uncharacterized protein (DUF169 family)